MKGVSRIFVFKHKIEDISVVRAQSRCLFYCFDMQRCLLWAIRFNQLKVEVKIEKNANVLPSEFVRWLLSRLDGSRCPIQDLVIGLDVTYRKGKLERPHQCVSEGNPWENWAQDRERVEASFLGLPLPSVLPPLPAYLQDV